MAKIKHLILLILFFLATTVTAQIVDISGKVVAQEDLEGVHIINKTSSKFTATNSQGIFLIPAKLNDTILVSAVKYKAEEVVITQKIIESRYLTIYLTESINELDEVVIGKVLTGNLDSDLQNSNVKRDINFYDVGIPGYTGKQKTQKERRLYEADNGKFIYYYGIAASINIHKILNRISGRTKKLQTLVRLEKQDECMNRAKSNLSEALFGAYEIEEELKIEFFYYASEDPKFAEICQLNNDMKMFEFLVEQLLKFNDNLEESKD